MQNNGESSELRPCYTCGICETICELEEIETHECVQGYHQIITDENLYFYAKDHDGNIIRRSLVDGAEQVVVDCSHNEGAQSSASWTNEKIRLEEQLISEVRQRPPLWNFKLSLAERGIRRKEILWEEISIKLNKVMSTKELKKKWKFLCDSFRAHCRKRKLPSGSAASSHSSWVHYESMQFLLDVQLQSLTTTNALYAEAEILATDDTGEALNDGNYEMDTNSSTDRCASNLSGNSFTGKRRRFDGDNELHDLAEALVKPLTFDQPLHINVDITKSATVPELAREDSVTHFTRFMESELRRIKDEDARNEIIRNLFEVLFDAKRELANKRKHN